MKIKLSRISINPIIKALFNAAVVSKQTLEGLRP